jgi:hypothetical protein
MFIHGILRQLSSTMWNNPKNILKWNNKLFRDPLLHNIL